MCRTLCRCVCVWGGGEGLKVERVCGRGWGWVLLGAGLEARPLESLLKKVLTLSLRACS